MVYLSVDAPGGKHMLSPQSGVIGFDPQIENCSVRGTSTQGGRGSGLIRFDLIRGSYTMIQFVIQS